MNYPTTFITFMNIIKKNDKYIQIYKKLGNPSPFDVSLRDGLQGLTKIQQQSFTLDKKKYILNNIIQNYELSRIYL